eukprot:jgi/Bigna1/67547/fgenesh1_pg.4_\
MQRAANGVRPQHILLVLLLASIAFICTMSSQISAVPVSAPVATIRRSSKLGSRVAIPPTTSMHAFRAMSKSTRRHHFPCFAENSQVSEQAQSQEPPVIPQGKVPLPPPGGAAPPQAQPTPSATEPEEEKMPTKFTRKQGIAIATGLVSIGLGFAYIVGSEIVGGRELKDPPPEALKP